VRQIVVADIGGTHARFALAALDGGQMTGMREPVILRTNDHDSFEAAWQEFGSRCGSPLPNELVIALAGAADGDEFKLTNNSWVLGPAELRRSLRLNELKIVNDFGAVAHAVATLEAGSFKHLCGPDQPLPPQGVITIIGPGTGLGVALLIRRADGSYDVVETEGGHIDFAPLDAVEDRILAELRTRFGRVSVERLVSGPGLLNIFEGSEQRSPAGRTDRELWTSALNGNDPLALAALERFCMCLGATAGDLALAHGAAAVVIGGGIGQRLAGYLPSSGFRERFIAKGRFSAALSNKPVKLITHPEPGLLGAAAAFARDHGHLRLNACSVPVTSRAAGFP
jgi:glucokinase